ncbi:3'-5' exonuclease DinG [Austwickia sp. TVS 96-490-7B]|uniref:3'-5' exonuclease n=1 Tax=Austwickia sp. TVS 96-490-7B TaxID=2830843 RepID=UPI001C5A12E4|nr:3'-5' exonuclease [Austwickia sp. TVS 96-490-7B]MBW3085384.1 3'-5' exonuclease DinG [Austwickia sp. TVS 96-490-7B]
MGDTTFTHLGCDIKHRSRKAMQGCPYGPHRPSSPRAAQTAAKILSHQHRQHEVTLAKQRKLQQKATAKAMRLQRSSTTTSQSGNSIFTPEISSFNKHQRRQQITAIGMEAVATVAVLVGIFLTIHSTYIPGISCLALGGLGWWQGTRLLLRSPHINTVRSSLASHAPAHDSTLHDSENLPLLSLTPEVIPASGVATFSQVQDILPHPEPAQEPSLPYIKNSIKAILTRKATGQRADCQVFTCIDVETTGPDPSQHRVCEVGAVKFSGDGTVLDEFSTLIRCPGSTTEAREMHQIQDVDLVEAPLPDDVWREVVSFLQGSIVVAHNFDHVGDFIASECQRANIPLPQLVGLCTFLEARRHLEGSAFTLSAMHRSATGTWRGDSHHALGDARATKDVLMWLITSCPDTLWISIPTPLPSSGISVEQRCRITPRAFQPGETSLAGIIKALPHSPTPRVGDPQAVVSYSELLSDCLKDERLTRTETILLASAVSRTGLTGTQLRTVHLTAWKSTFPDYQEKDIHTSRINEMRRTASHLGLTDIVEDLNRRFGEPNPNVDLTGLPLKGMRFGFLGSSDAIIKLRTTAETYGAPTVKVITKTVQWVAADNCNGQSRSHLSARKYGISIIDVNTAAVLLNDIITRHEQERLDHEELLRAELRQMERQRQDRDADVRHTWRTSELPDRKL